MKANFAVSAEATVYLHAGMYLAHDLLSAMPLTYIGRYVALPGELLWERIARALQHVEPGGPYPMCDALTILVRDDCVLTARFDVVVTARGAEATIVSNGVPRWKHAPIVVDIDEDVLAVARELFPGGCHDAENAD